MQKAFLAIAAIAALTACSPAPGPGLGPVGAINRVEALPVYRFFMNGDPSPEDALAASEARIRTAQYNLRVIVDNQSYLMRQMGLNDENFVVVESAAPAEALVGVIRERSGCQVDPQPLLSQGAAIYTLDCT